MDPPKNAAAAKATRTTSQKRISALVKKAEGLQGAGSRLTVVITFAGFPLVAQKAEDGSPVKYWGFSHGINSTYQYAVDTSRPPRVILQTPLEKELGSDSGEGVDVFTIHGTRKQQLILTIYASSRDAPYWFRSQEERTGKAPEGGLFATIVARIPSSLAQQPVTVMKWAFYQSGRISMSGGTNVLKNPQGPQMLISFESEEN